MSSRYRVSGVVFEARSSRVAGHFAHVLPERRACSRIFDLHQEMLDCCMFAYLEASCVCGRPPMIAWLVPDFTFMGRLERPWSSLVCLPCHAIVGPLSATEAEERRRAE